MRTEDIYGAWVLVSWENRRANGEVSYPMGEKPVGINIYDPGGYMSGQIMRAGRPEFVSGHMRRGTADEIRAAFEGYLAYFGRYEFDPETSVVTHYPDGALFPNWVGVAQPRYVTFDGTYLTLKTPALLVNGVEQVGVLTWQRLPRGSGEDAESAKLSEAKPPVHR